MTAKEQVDESYHEFIRKTGEEPKSIYLGWDNYRIFRDEMHQLLSFTPEGKKPGLQVLRMKYRNALVYRVDEEHHLAVC